MGPYPLVRTWTSGFAADNGHATLDEAIYILIRICSDIQRPAGMFLGQGTGEPYHEPLDITDGTQDPQVPRRVIPECECSLAWLKYISKLMFAT